MGQLRLAEAWFSRGKQRDEGTVLKGPSSREDVADPSSTVASSSEEASDLDPLA